MTLLNRNELIPLIVGLPMEQQSGREALNNFEQLTEWRTVLNSYFKQEMTKMRTTSCARKDHVG
jgi:hypothetical protein